MDTLSNSSELEEKSNPKNKKFIKPTIEEIRAYCSERRNNVDAESFYDFYESKGWFVGKNPMKDWKAAVRTWEKNDYGKNRQDDSESLPDWPRSTVL